MKKIVLIFLVISLLALANWVLAFELSNKYPKIILPQGKDTSLPQLIEGLFKFLVRISFLVVMIMIIYGGFLYLISAGRPLLQLEAREKIFSALVGLLIVLISYFALHTINPNLFRTEIVTKLIPKTLVNFPQPLGRMDLKEGVYLYIDAGWSPADAYFAFLVKDHPQLKQGRKLEIDDLTPSPEYNFRIWKEGEQIGTKRKHVSIDTSSLIIIGDYSVTLCREKNFGGPCAFDIREDVYDFSTEFKEQGLNDHLFSIRIESKVKYKPRETLRSFDSLAELEQWWKKIEEDSKKGLILEEDYGDYQDHYRKERDRLWQKEELLKWEQLIKLINQRISGLEEGQTSIKETVQDLKVIWEIPEEIPVEVPEVETYQEPLWELAE